MKKIQQIHIEKLVEVKKADNIENIYDISINNLNKIKEICDSFECHIFLYPYNRHLTSSDVRFRPFEEYVVDINNSRRTIYKKIPDTASRVFGLFLGFVITLVFGLFYPNGLLSIEAIVSIFGAYTIGKEIWEDIKNFLVSATERFRLRVIESYYSYKLDKYNTLTKYSNYAKKFRFKKFSLLPQKIEFIELSNSQTVRMYFDKSYFNEIKEDSVRILSIHINHSKIELFNKSGFMLGVKVSLNRNSLFVRKSLELFQSCSRGELGCLDQADNWLKDSIFYRKTFQIGNLKYFWRNGIIEHTQMIDHNIEFVGAAE